MSACWHEEPVHRFSPQARFILCKAGSEQAKPRGRRVYQVRTSKCHPPSSPLHLSSRFCIRSSLSLNATVKFCKTMYEMSAASLRPVETSDSLEGARGMRGRV